MVLSGKEAMTQPNQDAMPADHVALAVVGATEACAHKGEDVGINLLGQPRCRLCIKTDGRILVFADETGVRMECRGWPVHPDLLENGESYCTKDTECLCHGLGYTATDRLEVLAKAVGMGNVLSPIWTGWMDYRYECGRGDTQAVYRIVAESLLAQGAILGATKAV